MRIAFSKKTLILPILVIISLLIVVYYNFNPSNFGFFPKCPLHFLTGYKCPGCGVQRAIHQLLHLNLAEALHFNALFVLSLPLIIASGVIEVFKDKLVKSYNVITHPTFATVIFVIVIVWWIVRNIYNW